MTNGILSQADSERGQRRLSVSTKSLKIVKPDDDHTYQREGTSDSEPSPKGTPAIALKPPLISSLTRQVSHDGLAQCSDSEGDRKQPASDSTRASPYHGEDSELEHGTTSLMDTPAKEDSNPKYVPPQPNPLHNHEVFRRHTQALRLEAKLHPMRLILARLMTHLNFNRKGVFNSPVDPVALGLPDYFTVITKPMDLGTVKNRLHSVAYKSRRAVVDDIRLCFRNAMLYNPPQNAIHIAARELLKYFEDQLSSFCPELADVALLDSSKTEESNMDVPILEHTEEDAETNSAETKAVAELCHGALFHNERTDDVYKVQPSLSTAHHFSTRNSHHDELCVTGNTKKRKKRGSKINSTHSCQWCNGNVCSVCEQGCLSLQPTLLICNGPHCIGAKIRKGATYFIAPDGSSQYCQRCYVGLPAVLPGKHEDLDLCCYKRNLLKRKNDEEAVEHWLTCSNCESTMHRMCVMHNTYVHSAENFACPNCQDVPIYVQHDSIDDAYNNRYTFVAGEDHPIPMSEIIKSQKEATHFGLCADLLPENSISQFIEEKVRQRMVSADYPNAENTIIVRMISDCERYFKVPEVVRKHFRLRVSGIDKEGVLPPMKVMYRSKAIALFQKFDGLDVCIFCMYVQEYDGDDEFDSEHDKLRAKQEKRVYIAYLDSVEHFRPRTLRTAVYQEVLTAYLATARIRGYEAAHIWACPPSRGNSFVFWNHPAAQRTPNTERLTTWYHASLSRAVECGVVTCVQSLYESDFAEPLRLLEENTSSSDETCLKMPCPPLLEGDFWIEEALRVHNATFSRLLKENSSPVAESYVKADSMSSICPAVQIAAMFREKIIKLPVSKAFRRPVNAAALKLSDYHIIISKPMDLGTVLSRCLLGEYETLRDLVNDVRLVFSNAKKFNPPGHIIHENAIELEHIIMSEITAITKTWVEPKCMGRIQHSWKDYETVSMSLCDSSNKCRLASKSSDKSACRKSQSEAQVDDRGNEVYDGPEAIRCRMVGDDVWLLEKKPILQHKNIGLLKGAKRGRKVGVDVIEEPAFKRRRQTWLGEEVGLAVRRMRTSFFKCSLNAPSDCCENELPTAGQAFRKYCGEYNMCRKESTMSSRVADARHSFLEVSQFRGLEFDTLRRAKYSSAVLLYHLHNEGAPGLIPTCTSCGKEIEGVRWHRTSRVLETRLHSATFHTGRKSKPSLPFETEELCSSCFSVHQDQQQFIPLQVSL